MQDNTDEYWESVDSGADDFILFWIQWGNLFNWESDDKE